MKHLSLPHKELLNLGGHLSWPHKELLNLGEQLSLPHKELLNLSEHLNLPHKELLNLGEHLSLPHKELLNLGEAPQFISQISFIVRKFLCRNEVNPNGLFLKVIEELQNILVFRMESM